MQRIAGEREEASVWQLASTLLAAATATSASSKKDNPVIFIRGERREVDAGVECFSLVVRLIISTSTRWS